MNKYFGLYSAASKKVKANHDDLFDSFTIVCRRKVSNFFSSRNNWIWIFILVTIFFIIPIFLDFPVFNIITFNKDTVRSLVDQRTTNIATIISISLVVVGFLINNLAIKSPVTYKLLFNRSLLYLTIYLTLSTIFLFIIISTIRDTIPELIYAKLVLAGTYLSLIILFLIGVLFRKIIYFTNEKEISSMLSQELLTEGKNKLKLILIKKYSSEIYKSFMDEREIVEMQHSITLETLLNSQRSSASDLLSVNDEDNHAFLHNVNLTLLNILIKFELVESYDSITIGDRKNFKKLDFIYLKDEYDQSTKQKFLRRCSQSLKRWFLKRCFLSTKKDIFLESSDIYRKEFDNKIFQLAEENKYRNLSDPLNSYLELYKIQMLNTK